MTFDGNEDRTAAHEALWDAVEDGDAVRLAALFGAVPGLRDVVDHIHPRSPFAADPPEPVLSRSSALASFLPLHHAAHLGYEDVCAVLLDNGATLDRRCDDKTPLTCAARNGKLGAALLLLDRGADADGRLREPPPAFEDFDPKSLLEDGGPPLLRDGKEYDGGKPSALGPLHYAAQRADERMVGLLLERGATSDLPDADGETALRHAGRINAVDATRWLMTAGGDEHCRNGGGEPPFEVASELWGVFPDERIDHWNAAGVMRGHGELMQVLDQVRGDASYSSTSPVASQMEGKRLWAHNVCKTSPWARGVWETLHEGEKLAAVRFCARLLWEHSLWDEGNWEPSSWSRQLWDDLCARDTPAVLSLLRADPRLARARHPSGATALHLGVYDAELTRELLHLDADVSAKDASGDTALHSAARLSAEASVRLLIAAGSAVGARNRTGVTAYDIAHGYRDEVDFSLWIDGTWSWASETPPGILFSEGGLAVTPDDLHVTGLNVSKQCPECHDFGVYTVYVGDGIEWVCDKPECDYREAFDDDGERASLPTFGAAATPTRGSSEGAT